MWKETGRRETHSEGLARCVTAVAAGLPQGREANRMQAPRRRNLAAFVPSSPTPHQNARVNSFRRQGPSGPEAQYLPPKRRVERIAERRPRENFGVPERATANDAAHGGLIHPWTTVCRGTFIVRVPRVLAPLPHVAVHVVQTEGICRLDSDRLSLIPRILSIPADAG